MKKRHVLCVLLAVMLLFNITHIKFSVSTDGDFYEVENSVSYRVDVNLTITHINHQPLGYRLTPVILNYQEVDEYNSGKIIPYQEATIFEPIIEGPYQQFYIETDEFGNGFYHINTVLNLGDIFSFSHSYEITLNSVSFDYGGNLDSNDLENTDEIHSLYCAPTNFAYLGDHPELVELSHTIVGDENDPVQIAKKIQVWVSSNINYGRKEYDYHDYSANLSYGALETYQIRKGVCWDIAELMVTLLRIQDIPARMVIGLALDDLMPVKGDKYIFYEYWRNDTMIKRKELPRHAWVEYYVPSLGWLACDPTWSDSYDDYFNTLDNVHFRIGGGSWFSLPYYPYYQAAHISLDPLSHFFLNYLDYDFITSITVLDSNYIDLDLLGTILITVMCSLGVIFLLNKSIKSFKRKHLKKDMKLLFFSPYAL